MKTTDIRFQLTSKRHQEAERYLSCLAHIYVNGGVVLAGFIPTNPESLGHVPLLDHQQRDDLFLRFLNSSSVITALPDLKMGKTSASDLSLQYRTPEEWEEELTQLVLFGGAYRSALEDAEKIKTMSRQLVTAFAEDQDEPALIGVTHKAWTPWFKEIAWDTTCVVHILQSRMFWLLCATDSD